MPTTPRRFIMAATSSATLVALLALPASAANTVTQTINAGTRTASVADLTLGAITYSHSAQASSGTMVLTADDSSGTGAGWNVTVEASEFGYSGPNNGSAIPAANFSVTSASGATGTAGEAVDAGGGPKVPAAFTAPATLDTARKTLQADAGYGEGTYTQNLGVSLSVPAQSRVGDYTGTLTVTISAAP